MGYTASTVFVDRSRPDGFLTKGQCQHEVDLECLDLKPCTEIFIYEDNVLSLTKAEESNTMSTGEDEPSPSLNGRLRPRRSTSTTTPSPRNKPIRKVEGKIAHERPKRTSTPSKASPAKQDVLITKSDAVPVPLFLCPYCDRQFNARQAASKHARRIHLSTSKQDNFIKCLYCNHSDAESGAIIKHMVDSHPNQYFACLDCHTRFPSTTELAEHKHNVCEKQKTPYRSKLRQKTMPNVKKNQTKPNKKEKTESPNGSTQIADDIGFNGIVISCELKPSLHDAADIEDKITTNLILPSSKALGNATVEKSAVIVLDDLQWNKRIPPNFSFHTSDADQILSRLGVVHRSPRVGGESRKDLIKMMDEPNEKFEKCFDTSFYSKVAKNVQENLAKFLDGTFNFNPNRDTTIKTRKSKASVVINTAEGFPILLAHEQFSRNLFDGFIPRAVAPKHKWKWDTAENDKNLLMLLDQTKRDSHVNSCIITLISSLDIWTQLRMKSKFEEIFKTTPTAKKTEKQNMINLELKEILESRDIPSNSTYVRQQRRKSVEGGAGSELCSYLGLSATSGECDLKPAVLSGEWVRPRCYVCCACGDQTRDARTLSAHLATSHPNAQVQHYEIVGETLLSADILKHLYVPPSQMSNRTRPPRGFRDCTKCKKSITLEDLHQHMLDCAGDTPTVRRKCRYRPFGVRRRRPRLPDNAIRKKIRKHIRSSHGPKSHMRPRPRPRIRTEVGDAETIRKMIADLPAKRNRITLTNVLKPRRPVLKTIKQVKLRSLEERKSTLRPVKSLNKPKHLKVARKQHDTDNSSTIDEDDQPLKLSATRVLTRKNNGKEALLRRAALSKSKEKKESHKSDIKMEGSSTCHYNHNTRPGERAKLTGHKTSNHDGLGHTLLPFYVSQCDVLKPVALRADEYLPFLPNYFPNQLALGQITYSHSVVGEIPQETLSAETVNQTALNESALESSHRRIDVKSAGPSNVRRHSSRNDENMQGGKDRSVDGDGHTSKQNNNIPQAPNVPLKHSIASLTSDTEIRDASMPYHHSYLPPPEMDAKFIHESGNGHNEFENEATVEKLDKPPLSKDSKHSLKSDKLVTDFSMASNLNATSSLLCDIGSRNPSVTSVLPNKPKEPNAASEHMFSQKKSILNECAKQPPCFKDNPIFDAKSHIATRSKELVGFNLEHQNTHSNTDMKLESDKIKINKMRKGLNDCIAMLRTKKGFRPDQLTSRQGDAENLDSEHIDLETIDSEGAVTVAQESSLSISKSTGEKAKKRKNVPLSYSSQNKDFSVSENRRLSIDQVPDITSIPILQKEKTLKESDCALQGSNQHEVAFNLTNPSKSVESVAKPRLAGSTQLDRLDISRRPNYSGDNNSDLALLQNAWSNAHGESLNCEEIDRYYRHRVNQTVKTLLDFNIPNLTHAILEVQAKLVAGKEGEIDIPLLHNLRVVDEIKKRQSMTEAALRADKNPVQEAFQVVASTAQAGAKSSQVVSRRAPSTEDLIDVKMTRQSSVSPSSRRSRRKPIKKKTSFELQLDFDSDQNIQQDHVMVSPRQHDSRRIEASPIDSNLGVTKSSYLPVVSPSHETLALKTPPPPPPLPNSIRTRRESYKRALNSSEINTTTVENRNNDLTNMTGARTNMTGTSTETHAESIVKMQSLRRQSIELANTQTMTGTHDNLSQKYRERYEKPRMSMSQPSKDISHVRRISLDANIDDNMHYDKTNEMSSIYPSSSTFVSVTQDTHGIMHVISTASNSQVNNNIETQEHYKKTHDNEQYMIKNQKSSTESKRDYRVDEHVDKYSSQESKVCKANANVIPIDTKPHILTTRKTPETYYTRPSSYQMNVSNTLDLPLDMGYNENRDIHDNALRAFRDSGRSGPSFVSTYSSNIKHLHNTISLLPPCESALEDIAPLDLSCDSKSRKEQTLNLHRKVPEVCNNIRYVPVSNETNSDISINANRQQCYGERLRNPLQLPLITTESEEPIEGPALQVAFNVSTQNFGKNNQEMPTPRGAYQSTLATTIGQPSDSTKSELLDRSLNDSSHKIGQFQSLMPEGNCFISQDPQKIISNAIYHREKKQETILFEKKDTAVQASCDAKLEIESSEKKINAPITAVDHNVENIYPRGSLPMGDSQHNSILNPTSIDRNIPNANSHEEAAESSENDILQTEHDAETARKIAMLPEELVKVLGTIPKDHRNQLLNILPQYVSTSHSNSENSPKNTLCCPRKTNEVRADYKQNNSTCYDSNRLSVNTAISPSSVIPKKRHSPSHSRGRLDSSESQSIGPVLPPSTLSQRSPTGHDESENNTKSCQMDCTFKTNDSESIVLDPIHNSSEKARIDKNISDLNHHVHLKKASEAASVELDYFPSTSKHDLTLKLPLKQKSPNEQTASLRAVRIKTTTTKKTFPDDKQLLGNYCYPTTVAVDEKCSNLEGVINFRNQACEVNQTNLNYDNNTRNLEAMEGNSAINVTLRNTIRQNTDCFQENIKTHKPVTISDTQLENSGHSDNVSQPLYTEASEHEGDLNQEVVFDDSQSNTITLEPSSVIPLQDVNTDVLNITEQVKSTTFSTSTIHEEMVVAQDAKIVVSHCELQPESGDTTSNIKPKSLEETTNPTENKSVLKCSDNNVELQALSLTFPKNNDAKHDKEQKNKVSCEISVPSVDENIYESSAKNEKSNEDDSEDDVALAVIKEKHYKTKPKARKRNIKKINSSAKSKSIDADSGKAKMKIANKVKVGSKPLKSVQKKSKTLNMTKVTRLSKHSVDAGYISKFEIKQGVEMKCNPFNVAKNVSADKNILSTKATSEVSEFNVHKEYTKSIKKSENSCDNSNLEINKVEDSHSNSENKDKSTETSNLSENMQHNLQPEIIAKLTTESTKESSKQNDSCNVEFDVSSVSVEEGQLNAIQTSQNTIEVCGISSVDRGNDTNLSSSSVLNKTKKNKKDVILDVSKTKIALDRAQIDSISSDLQLCSEVSGVNTTPLRRSRRGKSMYVDSCYEDIGTMKNSTKNTPLTMKRLILSRVEKDKRVGESNIEEKACDSTDNILSIASEKPETSCVKKGKLIKRKKSPHSKRNSKKSKSISLNDHDEDVLNFSSLHSISENNSSILRELPNAENKITEKDVCNDDVKLRSIVEHTLSLSENTTIVSTEGEADIDNDIIIETKESTTSSKKKLHTTKPSDVLSKPKKTKYHKKKPQSDFDSDDDKVLLETKHKIATEKYSNCEDSSSSKSKEEGVESKNEILGTCHDLLEHRDNLRGPTEPPTTCYSSDISKEDNNEKPSKGHPTTNKIIIPNACNDTLMHTQIATASACNETRVTCYSKSISNKRPRSSPTSLKNHSNYDPYDFDLIDIIETTGPIVKKKCKDASSNQFKSVYNLHHDHKRNKRSSISRDINERSTGESKQKMAKIQLNTNADSDSDSSKSDVPLQKYVDEKTSKIDIKDKNIVIDCESTNEMDEIKDILNQKCYDSKETCTTVNTTNNVSVNDPHISGSGMRIEKPATTDEIVCETEVSVEQQNSDNMSMDQSTQKQTNKQKKSRQILEVNTAESSMVSSKEDQQLKSDKFMENFGFYSERIPRKSNLLASKKISETFHMICNENDDFGYREKSSRKSSSNESKKKPETDSTIPAETGTEISQDLKTMTSDATGFDAQVTEPKPDIFPNVQGDVMRIDDSDLDFLAAQAIMDSEEVRNLENDLFSSLREAAEAGGARHCFVSYQNTRNLNTTAKDVDQNDSFSQMEDKIIENSESIKKCNKSKQNKQPGVKDKMYPDIEEIDMFEDKFDKIKRKRRSQAVAAKQVQAVPETNSSGKSRKQSDKKKNVKNAKKKYQSAQVPTKGALKGFEGIKISIPTQDLNMPINVSPPRQSKKRRKTTARRRKDTNDLDSSCSEFDDKDKSVLDRDIYEFKESEDAELFDLRPSTVMDRFRSMHNKNKFKYKDKDKPKDTEKEKIRGKDKERKIDVRDSTNFEMTRERDKYSNVTEREKCQKKYLSREERRSTENESQSTKKDCDKNFFKPLEEDVCMKEKKRYDEQSNDEDDQGKNETDSAIASTSGLVRDPIDESDYESEMSSPEGDFIFYMSNDINCVCASDNDSDESDAERGCGRLNCVNKNRNADKNAAIENIFKNNAVRCEKPDLNKEPEKPRPNLDQLFDSLLENESKPDKDMAQSQKDVTTKIDLHRNITPLSPVKQDNATDLKDGNCVSVLSNDVRSIFHNSATQHIFKSDERTQAKSDYASSLCQNDNLTDSGSMQMFTVDDKSKENLGYSLMSEESTQVNFSDIIAHTSVEKEEINDKNNVKGTKTGVSENHTKYDSEDEFDIDKPETLNRHYMHLILPAEKTSTCAQTDNSIDNEDTGNESAASKYLRGLSPSEAAKMEIYTMVSAQSTQTDKSKRTESEDEKNVPVFPRSRIRLQKYDIREIAHKSKSTKSIQTDKNKGCKSSHYDDEEAESDDDVGKTDQCKLAEKETDLVIGSSKGYKGPITLYQDNDPNPVEDEDAFTAPASRSAEKNSPRKSDEGISTSHDYSADAFDQMFEHAGVARQRARRKCAVGKQNVLAEHWSSESEFDGAPPRPNSADSVIASAPRKKKNRKKEGHHASGKKASRHLSKGESKGRGRGASGARTSESEVGGGNGRPPAGPKMRARAAHHYWSSEGEEVAGPQPQHGWIVGDSHKKLVTMLAHAKGRKRHSADKHLD